MRVCGVPPVTRCVRARTNMKPLHHTHVYYPANRALWRIWSRQELVLQGSRRQCVLELLLGVNTLGVNTNTACHQLGGLASTHSDCTRVVRSVIVAPASAPGHNVRHPSTAAIRPGEMPLYVRCAYSGQKNQASSSRGTSIFESRRSRSRKLVSSPRVHRCTCTKRAELCVGGAVRTLQWLRRD